MSDMVNHPPHYLGHPSGLECIDVTSGLTFAVGNAVKYLWRAEAKNGVEDLHKAIWYLDYAVQHDDPVFASRPWRTMTRLQNAARHETDPDRARFFNAIAAGDLEYAKEIVSGLI
jgi:hypothetical protein